MTTRDTSSLLLLHRYYHCQGESRYHNISIMGIMFYIYADGWINEMTADCETSKIWWVDISKLTPCWEVNKAAIPILLIGQKAKTLD